MSALADLSAALLPPEAGGPRPERVAACARKLIAGMPPERRAAVGVGLAALEAAALLRGGRRLGALPHERRARLLGSVADLGAGPAAALDGLKTIVLLAAGADTYAPEIAATGSRQPPVRSDPELAIVPGEELGPLSCDAIVVGSGAGGAFAARALACAGLDVLIVEEGDRWDSARIRAAHPLERFASLYRDSGSTLALGAPPIALPMGRAVGGTTVINSGTCYRPPKPVIRDWRDRHGTLLASDGFEERLAEVERTIGVGPVPAAVMGRNGELALSGAAALGWRAAPLERNAPGCRGACQCAIGCPNNAKAGVHLTALPQACEAGARIASALRVERIAVEDGTTTVHARRANGSRVALRAKKVVLSAGAVETPALLRRSGLGRHPRLGRGLSIHPALGAAGAFADPVYAWHGVLQSAGVEELHEREGVLIEATSTPPGMGSMTISGLGSELVGALGRAHHTATIGAMIADEPSGRVVGARRPLVLYRLSRRDRGRLRVALEALGRLLLAAGAQAVELGGSAPAVRRPEELPDAVARIDIRRLHLAAFHPTGTAAAGADPARHPVGPIGELRGTRGVWVADASILPSCPGVNPQVSIMAVAAGVGEAAARA